MVDFYQRKSFIFSEERVKLIQLHVFQPDENYRFSIETGWWIICLNYI